MCSKLWSGETCDKKICENDCSGHGICGVNKTCLCNDGWYGADCSYKHCKDDCNEHGYCFDGVCFCKNGFTGPE